MFESLRSLHLIQTILTIQNFMVVLVGSVITQFIGHLCGSVDIL